MKALPTHQDLEAAGSDAGGLLDAHEWDLERAIPHAATDGAKRDLVDDLKQLRRLRKEWFA